MFEASALPLSSKSRQIARSQKHDASVTQVPRRMNQAHTRELLTGTTEAVHIVQLVNCASIHASKQESKQTATSTPRFRSASLRKYWMSDGFTGLARLPKQDGESIQPKHRTQVRRGLGP